MTPEQIKDSLETLTTVKELEKAAQEYYSIEKQISSEFLKQASLLHDMLGLGKQMPINFIEATKRSRELTKSIQQSKVEEKKLYAEMISLSGTQRKEASQSLQSMIQRRASQEAELGLLKNIQKQGLIPIIYLFSKMFALFKEFDKAGYDFRMSMGMTRDAANEVRKIAQKVSIEFMNVGVNIETAYASISALGTEMGSIHIVTKSLVATTSLLKAQLGVAVEDSAGFFRNMAAVSDSTMASQENMAFMAAKMADIAGVPLPKVMGDIAKMSSVALTMVSRMPFQIVKAAIEARRLNTTLNDMAQGARSILNFTESVNAEMEASVLIGKSINMQNARELAYKKDLVGYNNEILRLTKDVDFDKLDVYQQEAFAAATGRSVDELYRMVQADREWQKARNSNDPIIKKQVAAIEAMRRSSKEGLMNDTEKLRISVMTIANQERLASISAKWSQILAKVGQVFLPIIDKILGYIADIINNKWVLGLGVVVLGVYGLIKAVRLLSAAWYGISFLRHLGFKGIADAFVINFGAASGKALNSFKSQFTGLFKGFDPKIPVVTPVATTVATTVADKVEGSVKDKAVEVAEDKLKNIGKINDKIDKVSKKSSGGIGKSIESFLRAIARGIGAFARPTVTQGSTNMLKGAGALFIVGASLIPFAYGMSLMKGIGLQEFEAAAGGIAVMTGAVILLGRINSGNVLKAAGALAIVGASIIPFAIGMNLMKDVKWETMIGAAAAMYILSSAAIALGAVMETVVGGVALALGIAALAALGGVMYIFAGAAKMGAEAMDMLAKVEWGKIAAGISSISILRLIGIGSAMSAATPGMIMFGFAALALGASMSLLGGIFKNLENLSFNNAILQINNLRIAIKNLSGDVKDMPNLNLDRFKSIERNAAATYVPALTVTPQGVNVDVNKKSTPATVKETKYESGKSLDDIFNILSELNDNLLKGKIKSGNLYMDSSVVSSNMARGLDFKGGFGTNK